MLWIVHVLLPGGARAGGIPPAYIFSPRDHSPAQRRPVAGRATRALDNYVENLRPFVALDLGLLATHHTGGSGATVWIARSHCLYAALSIRHPLCAHRRSGRSPCHRAADDAGAARRLLLKGTRPAAKRPSGRPGRTGQENFSMILRSRRDRHRPRRLCLRDPRGAARHEGRRRREAQDASAAPASTSAASRRRRCSTPRKCSRRRAHGLAPLGVVVGAPKLDLAGDDEAQGRHRRRQRQRRRLPVQEEQDRAVHRRGPHRRARQGRGQGRRRRRDDARDQGDRHRHRLRRRAAAGRRDRRENGRLLDRRAEPAETAGASCWWSAPASSGSNSARSGRGSAPK